jgi:hypothetical protein
MSAVTIKFVERMLFEGDRIASHQVTLSHESVEEDTVRRIKMQYEIYPFDYLCGHF